MRSAGHVLQLILHLSIVRTAINACLQKMQVSATTPISQQIHKNNAILSSHVSQLLASTHKKVMLYWVHIFHSL